MRLAKEEFVKEVENLIEMSNQINGICYNLDTSDCIFDNWFNSYFECVRSLCDINPVWDENWDGSPFDYWIFKTEHPFRIDLNSQEEEVQFESVEEVYDYLVANCQTAS